MESERLALSLGNAQFELPIVVSYEAQRITSNRYSTCTRLMNIHFQSTVLNAVDVRYHRLRPPIHKLYVKELTLKTP
jgi:glutathionyl-hydroquinone reductase